MFVASGLSLFGPALVVMAIAGGLLFAWWQMWRNPKRWARVWELDPLPEKLTNDVVTAVARDLVEEGFVDVGGLAYRQVLITNSVRVLHDPGSLTYASIMADSERVDFCTELPDGSLVVSNQSADGESHRGPSELLLAISAGKLSERIAAHRQRVGELLRERGLSNASIADTSGTTSDMGRLILLEIELRMRR